MEHCGKKIAYTVDDSHEGGSLSSDEWGSLWIQITCRPRFFVVTNGAVKCIVETDGVD